MKINSLITLNYKGVDINYFEYYRDENKQTDWRNLGALDKNEQVSQLIHLIN